MRNRLKTIVDVKLGSHVDEAEGVDTTNESVKKERIVAFVITICERIIGITENQGISDFLEIVCCYLIVFLDSVFDIVFCIGYLYPRKLINVRYFASFTNFP